jgi:hypothetical protein
VARKAREEAEAAEQWQRDMATPPTLGVVLEVAPVAVIRPPDRVAGNLRNLIAL